MEEKDFPLPPLNPLLKLYPAAASDGEPAWSLHNPVANTYFKIAWAEFECLSRFSKARTAAELKAKVEAETAVKLTLADIHDLVLFLHSNGLLALTGKAVAFEDKTLPLGKRILHGYLYFTIPLFRPDAFLQRTLPFVRPFLSQGFIGAMLVLLGIGLIMTMQRADEFFHSFTGFFSLEGVIRGLAVLWLVKVVHEFAHAYTAAKYGVPVPHMGVAMIVMYPVLYTETTGGWQLASRQARFHIGMAGILAELCLAAIFLLLWNVMPAGSPGQSLAFTVVAIALVGSLLVNLNPLMRFDGYYMMSDLTGIENLQQRACSFARWKLRKILFSLSDDAPEALPADKQKFLTWFGTVLLIYRFFLFVGISVLVYHIFFKPLGLILMLVELVWFIGLPILSELAVWWQRRRDILRTTRARYVLAGLMLVLLIGIVPWQRTVHLPAVYHASASASIYPYAPSYIDELMVHDGQQVRKGDILVRLSSLELGRQLSVAQVRLDQLQQLQRRVQTDPELLQEKYATLDLEIQAAAQKVDALHQQEKNLIVTAPHDGVIRDLDPDIKAGRYIRQADLLFRVVATDAQKITGYVYEDDRSRIEAGDSAVFIPDGQPLTSLPLNVVSVAETGAASLAWPELSSLFKGDIPSEYDRQNGQIVPLRSVYQAELRPAPGHEQNWGSVQSGTVRVQGRLTSPMINFMKGLAGLVIREIGLN